MTSNFSLTSVKVTRSLDNLFMFKGSEKGLKEDPLCFGSPEGEFKSDKES